MAKLPDSCARFAALTLTAVLATSGCMDDPSVVIKSADLNELRTRSVRVLASNCRVNQSEIKYKKCTDIDDTDLLRVAEMRGVNGAAMRAVKLDDHNLTKENFGALSAFFSRIPFGYGCAPTLQGIFPSPKQIAKCEEKDKCDDAATPSKGTLCRAECVKKHSDPDKIGNYDLSALDELIGVVRTSNAVPLWTAGYGLGKGKGACNYGPANKTNKSAIPYTIDGKVINEHLGAAIQDPVKWAKVVRRIVKWYNRELPKQTQKDDPTCKIAKPTTGNPRSWKCKAPLFNIEFGRDPNGAGGFNDATKKNWLTAYTEFATQMRDEFPWPSNTVRILGPSVVVNNSLLVPNAQSWLFDFIDHVVAKKLPLSWLSFEVVASDAIEARNIAQKVRDYADKKKLLDEDGKAIGLFVTSLRLDPKGLPKSLVPNGDGSEADKLRQARYSAYEGAFFAATKTLWQGIVKQAAVGRVVRFPTVKPGTPPDDVAKTAADSNLIWYPADKRPPVGTLKPAAWHAFWFNNGFLGGGAGRYANCTPGAGSHKPCKESKDCKGKDEVCTAGKCTTECSDIAAEKRRKSIIQSMHGPDAAGIAGVAKTNEKDQLIVLATRENCVDALGKPLDCVIETDAAGNLKPTFPAVTLGRKHIIRVLVADLNVDKKAKLELLLHNLSVRVQELPKELNTKTVGYRWARMDGNRSTWCNVKPPHNCTFVFPEQGVLDVTDNSFTITRDVAVPSLHYFEFLY